MASRNRNRPNMIKEEADEEKALWHQVRNDGKRIDSLVADHNEKWTRMQDIKGLLDSQYAREDDTSEELDEELMSLSRENVKLCEEIISAVEGEAEQDVNSLLGALNLLMALRASSEAESHTPAPRAASSRETNKPVRKRKADTASQLSADDRESIVAESPAAPSPKVHIPASTRLKVGTSSSRAGSVPAAREPSVKIEDGGSESGVEATKKSAHDRPKYAVGTEVMYRKKGNPKDKDMLDGEGILCQVTDVIGEGKQRRYEIRDIDPEPGEPATPYRASLQQMTPIPASPAKLPDLPPKKNVLALYPSTTTFYKAEVVPFKSTAGNAPQSGYVRLRFEGEDEADREMDVERRYVLSDWTGK